MSLIPNTQIAVKFVPAPPGKFAPLYYTTAKEAAGLTLGSVNAGNSDQLYVDGGGINQGFHDLFIADKQDTAQYAALHKALLDKADKAADAFEVYAAGSNPLAFSYVRTARVTDKDRCYDGVCFVDVFTPAYRPHGLAANAAMVYLAPPKGDNYNKDKAAFLTAVKTASEHVVATVSGYNAIAAQHGQPALDALRLCLFSSGIYNSLDVSPYVIARTIYAGLCGALAKDSAGLKELQLPVPGDPLFAAVQLDLLP